MPVTRSVQPVLKWVGGKRQLLPSLLPLLPADTASCPYCEPFAGGAALLFALQPRQAWVNDINADLIRVYTVIRDDVDALVAELKNYSNDADFFYALRDLDRDREAFAALPEVKKAARLLYLNKTCYNGLYRVNNAGEFNTPFGRYRHPNIVNEAGLRACAAYLRQAEVYLSSRDYAAVLQQITKDTFVYLDPPYDPLSPTSNFTGYACGGFSRDEQIRLRECCDDLNRRGIRFMLSNSDTSFIREQYRNYRITRVKARRCINSVASKRGDVPEVIIRNYDRKPA